jgi:hypothetical protein
MASAEIVGQVLKDKTKKKTEVAPQKRIEIGLEVFSIFQPHTLFKTYSFAPQTPLIVSIRIAI